MASLHRLSDSGYNRWQVLFTVVLPKIEDRRWGSLVKHADGKITTFDLNEHRRIDRTMEQIAIALFPPDEPESSAQGLA
ncbi:MAG: hypothetical protein KIT44_06520 [Opitutaceae bacterium]|nr:hypothetical protein [Opitutaceae bacterium]